MGAAVRTVSFATLCILAVALGIVPLVTPVSAWNPCTLVLSPGQSTTFSAGSTKTLNYLLTYNDPGFATYFTIVPQSSNSAWTILIWTSRVPSSGTSDSINTLVSVEVEAPSALGSTTSLSVTATNHYDPSAEAGCSVDPATLLSTTSATTTTTITVTSPTTTTEIASTTSTAATTTTTTTTSLAYATSTTKTISSATSTAKTTTTILSGTCYDPEVTITHTSTSVTTITEKTTATYYTTSTGTQTVAMASTATLTTTTAVPVTTTVREVSSTIECLTTVSTSTSSFYPVPTKVPQFPLGMTLLLAAILPAMLLIKKKFTTSSLLTP